MKKQGELVVQRRHCNSCGGYFTMIKIWDCSNCRKIEWCLEEKK
jgi:predicted Zn-ribbon and HTH transcriptional regulator